MLLFVKLMVKDILVPLQIYLKDYMNISMLVVVKKVIKGAHGLNNFLFYVYEFTSRDKVSLISAEQKFLSYFPVTLLYNFKLDATSMTGYKHTPEAIFKMVTRFEDPTNHPMFNKNHSEHSRMLISKATTGSNNPMFGKTHSDVTKLLISAKHQNTVSLYNSNNEYILAFQNYTKCAQFVGCHKGTVGRYKKSGKSQYSAVHDQYFFFK